MGIHNTKRRDKVSLRASAEMRARTARKVVVASGTVAGVVGLASAADHAAKCGDTRLDWVSAGPPTQPLLYSTMPWFHGVAKC